MNAKFLLALSILANVALTAAYLKKDSTPASAPTPNAPVVPAAKVETPKTSTPAAPAPATAAAVVVRSITNTAVQKIDWRMVESADYRQYISNLRGIGCPEETIRDIITAN